LRHTLLRQAQLLRQARFLRKALALAAAGGLTASMVVAAAPSPAMAQAPAAGVRAAAGSPGRLPRPVLLINGFQLAVLAGSESRPVTRIPEALRSSPLVRFQRAWICGVPFRVVPRKANWALTKLLER